MRGHGGAEVTVLYWTREGKEDAAPASSTRKNPAPVKSKLRWIPPAIAARQKSDPTLARVDSESGSAARHAGDAQAPPAGTAYGSLVGSALFGHEVRPALPLWTSDPVVGESELAGLEGNVVVEITIDERGNIVAKTVIQSLAPAVDAKILAALESWRFRPATRDGVAIPSKQDVYYHFPMPR